MKQSSHSVDPAVLSAAFTLVFRKGRSPPSCAAPNDTDLLNRIRDAVPAVSPAVCRDALIKVRRLSFDVLETASAFREGHYGTDSDARAKALCEIEDQNPGFSDEEYCTAFEVGMIWAAM